MNWLFVSGDQSIGASASAPFLLMNIDFLQEPLGTTLYHCIPLCNPFSNRYDILFSLPSCPTSQSVLFYPDLTFTDMKKSTRAVIFQHFSPSDRWTLPPTKSWIQGADRFLALSLIATKLYFELVGDLGPNRFLLWLLDTRLSLAPPPGADKHHLVLQTRLGVWVDFSRYSCSALKPWQTL